MKIRVDLLMKGCSCKSGRMEKLVVLANCNNTKSGRVAEMENSHHGTLQDDISAVMQNVFGPQVSEFLDSREISEDSDSNSISDELEGPNPES